MAARCPINTSHKSAPLHISSVLNFFSASHRCLWDQSVVVLHRGCITSLSPTNPRLYRILVVDRCLGLGRAIESVHSSRFLHPEQRVNLLEGQALCLFEQPESLVSWTQQ